MMLSTSKNASVARSGNLAEKVLCKSHDILEILGPQYFGKKIVKCENITGNTKSDLLFTFEDGSQTTAQLKNGTGGGRGWSFDRRSVSDIPADDSLKELIKSVCLKNGGERKSVLGSKEVVKRLLLGDDDTKKPEHFLHTTMNNEKIESLTGCPTPLFVNTILEEVYENVNPKRTCVHLTPLIYLQRKGGGKADHSPNDIQAKLRAMPDCMKQIILQ